MRRLRPILVLLAGLGLASGAGAAPDGATPAGREVPIPVGVPVALDGLVPLAEWEGAAPCPTGGSGPELRVQQVRGTWLLALGSASPWPQGARFTIYARAGLEDASIFAAGTLWIDVEPREHNRPHVLVQVRSADGSAWNRVDGLVVARFANLDTAASFELAVDAAATGVAGEARPPLRWFAIVGRPGSTPAYRTFPTDLVLAGKDARALGPDLSSSARWALTTTWPRAEGKGAYSPTEWKALVDEDARITALGERAHALAIALDEAGTPDPASPVSVRPRGKTDGPILEGLVEALRAIATREPLTHADLRAYARGLLELNRPTDAQGILEGLVLGRRGAHDADDLVLLARAATAAERFEDAARALDLAATRVAPSLAPGYAGSARSLRATATAAAWEGKARAEDAAKDDQPLARLRTSKGDVFVRLLEDDVPEAVAQFVHLAEEAKADDGSPFYAGTLFHVVEAGDRALGGDPSTKGGDCERGGEGGTTWWVVPETNTRHRCFRGAVAFDSAKEGKVRSRFFVTTGPKLDAYGPTTTVFGTVIAGMDVVDRLERCDRLLGVDILRRRPHPYAPKKRT